MACALFINVPYAPPTPHPPPIRLRTSLPKLPSLSSVASFRTLKLHALPTTPPASRPQQHASTFIQAAWTRRSKGQPGTRKSKKSWKQRVEKYMKPFILDVLVSRKYIHAKVMHRVTSKVVSVATTNAKDLRNTLPSLIDMNACKVIGKLIAERSKDADVYAVTYTPRKGEKVEGKLAAILDTIVENDIAIV